MNRKANYHHLLTIFLFCIPVLLTTSCSNSNEDSYLGHWKVTDRDEKVMSGEVMSEFKITKEGGEYFFDGIGHDFYLGRGYQASLNSRNGALVLTGIPQIGDLELKLIENRKTLLFRGKKFKKDTEGN